jgi:hypothetical protein
MTYQEFRDWCNRRACDGCWGIGEISICMAAVREVEDVRCWIPWKEKKLKEKKWQEVEAKYEIMETIVKPIYKICGVR